MAHEYEEFRVYVVEVCQGCSWNHLTVSFVLGNGGPPGNSGTNGQTDSDTGRQIAET